MDPVFSVVIPTYNQAGLLEKAIRSVINQSFEDWEIIVIDNYSSDDTQEVIKRLNDTRIQYIKFRNRGVIAASRNKGISFARGTYIAFLDSDDLWHPSKLSRCLDYLSRAADAVCHGMRICRNGRYGSDFIPKRPEHDFYETLLYDGNSVITTSTVIVKKDLLEKYGGFCESPDVITAEDYDLWLRLLKQRVHWSVIPEILGEYTMHSANSSNNVIRQMQAEYAVLREHTRELSNRSLSIRMRIKKRQMMIAFRAGRRVQQNGLWLQSIPIFIWGLSAPFKKMRY